MIHVIPIAISTVDWDTYLSTAKKLLCKSVSGSIDRHNLRFELSSFLVSLSELKDDKTIDNPTQILRDGGGILRHGFASFLCVMPTIVMSDFREEVDLAIWSTASPAGFYTAVLSGDLERWRSSIINCSSSRVTTGVRSLSNKLMAYFESSGLGPIWDNFAKTPVNDLTFKLTSK